MLVTHCRYAFRLLQKSPSLVMIATTALALGIGASAAMFSLVNAVIFHALPFPESQRLIQISPVRGAEESDNVSYPDYLDFRRDQRSCELLGLTNWTYLDWSVGGHAERLTGVLTTASLFELTGKPFILGRPFTDDEDKRGGSPVAVLSEDLWRRRFNADPSVIGKSIVLSSRSYQVIGVCQGQVGDVTTPPDDIVFVPARVADADGYSERRDLRSYLFLGRLKAGVSARQAQEDFGRIQDGLSAQYPDADKGLRILIRPLQEQAVEGYGSAVWSLAVGACIILLISVANVSNLLSARALDRRREVAVRATLGASQADLIGQLITESAVFSSLGSVAGLGVAALLIRLVRGMSPDWLSVFRDVRLDVAAVGFTFGLSLVVALVSGFMPAVRMSDVNLIAALRGEEGRSGTAGPGRQKLHLLLVTAQAALASVLLVGASLLAHSLRAVHALPLGFNPHRLLTVDIYPTAEKYQDGKRLRSFFDALLEKASQMPGVTAAAMNSEQPFEWTVGDVSVPFHVVGQPEQERGKEPTFCAQEISPGYFRTMEIPLLRGRDFNAADRDTTQNVAIIDDATARRSFGQADPMGKQIELPRAEGDQKRWTIVGVVAQSRHHAPGHGSPELQAYFPYEQRKNLYRLFLLLRTSGDPKSLMPAMQGLVSSVDPEVPLMDLATYDDLITSRLWVRTLNASLAEVFSIGALLLSGVGLYGTTAYAVGRRSREIAVRMALGARAADVAFLVLKQGLRPVFLGTIIGLCAAAALVRAIEGALYGVSPFDLTSFATSALVLSWVAALACLGPTRRAMRVDPSAALRQA